MSRYRGRASVSVDVDVYLDQFDDDDILKAAREIVVHHRLTKEPDPGSYGRDEWAKTDAAISELATGMCMSQPVLEGHPDWPPPSTAAKITSIEELRALCGRQATPVAP